MLYTGKKVGERLTSPKKPKKMAGKIPATFNRVYMNESKL
jgi:hypothetical protein